MSHRPAHRDVQFDPVAEPAAVVVAGQARFTVLTSRLIRLEYSPDGRFEDRPSQAFWYRRQAVPPFTVKRDGRHLHITTEHLELIYRGGPFTPESLAIQLRAAAAIWCFGDDEGMNLLGTARTLDAVSGATTLSTGLLSRAGWAVVDDSATMVFNDEGWLEGRGAAAGSYDGYFFGYGRAYRDCLTDYCRLTGDTPLLPRWALGNWWSRYWPYRQDELLGLMRDFRDHQVPLSVCIVDMDWHLVNVGPGINGWTGYTWNRELFPDPPGFIRALHDMGLRTALNLHPALGVRPHEEMYPEMARRLGVDPASGKTIPFDIADPTFAQAYFEVLHHPQEAAGVDFWWIDWQQGTSSSLEGLDPLWWLNHLHFYDLGRASKRPFIFSRWGGHGNHRYPIGFSGDTHVTWDSLAFQPYFTATAANVAYGWWSHDIGGHMEGVEDGELFTRWVQFGLFSPILRLHSALNRFQDRRPWGYDAEVLRVTRDAMQLRHALIPYLYTQSWINSQVPVAPVRPLYHDFPDANAAYHCPQAYLFGGDLVVAPYVEPADADTRLSRQAFWLPPGDWYHFFDGEYHAGDAWYVRHGRLDDIPVFARAGAIIPLGPRGGWGGVENPQALEVHCFTGADGRFVLYEDDGVSLAYQAGARALTTFAQTWEAECLTVTVGPVEGDRSLVPAQRTLSFHLHGLARPQTVELLIDGRPLAAASRYDAERERLIIDGIELPVAAALRLEVCAEPGTSLASRRNRAEERVIKVLEAFRLETLTKSITANRAAALIDDVAALAELYVDLTQSQMRALIETTQGVGAHVVRDLGEPVRIMLWNNRGREGFRHRYAEVDADKWRDTERFKSQAGQVTRFESLAPRVSTWRLTVDYFGLCTLDLGGSERR